MAVTFGLGAAKLLTAASSTIGASGVDQTLLRLAAGVPTTLASSSNQVMSSVGRRATAGSLESLGNTVCKASAKWKHDILPASSLKSVNAEEIHFLQSCHQIPQPLWS